MSIREAKGREIADRFRIVKNGNLYLVPSQSGKGKYKVDLERGRCNCPDFEFTQAKCKHLFAVELIVRRERKTVTETNADGSTKTTVTETSRSSAKRIRKSGPLTTWLRRKKRPSSFTCFASFVRASAHPRSTGAVNVACRLKI